MKKKFYYWTIVAFVCCFWGEAVFSQKAQARSSALDTVIEQKKTLASSLLHQGLYVEATDAFLSILRDDPDSDEVNVGLMVAAYKGKQYSHALFACERLLAKYPNDINLRIQLATIYVALGEPASARQALDQIKQLDPTLTDSSLDSLVANLEKQKSRWTVNGSLSVGHIYDSNSNAGPASEKISLGPLTLNIPGAEAKSSHGFFNAMNLNMGYRLKEDGAWWWVADVAGFKRWNTAPRLLYNKSMTWGRVATGFRYVGPKSIFEVRVKGEEIYQEHAKDLSETVLTYGLELLAVGMATEKLQLLSKVGLEQRRFTVNKLQDGEHWNVGVYGRYFFGSANHEIMTGAQLAGGQADFKGYSSRSVEPSVRLRFNLPYDTYITSHAVLRHERYATPATGLETDDRKDNHWRLGAGVGWDITRSLSLGVQYEYIKNYSNSELYQYRQDMVTTTMTLNF